MSDRTEALLRILGRCDNCETELEHRLVSNGPDDYDEIKWCPSCREEQE
jgi:hypothetical protein